MKPDKTQSRKPMILTDGHAVKGTRLLPPFPDGLETAIFGKGCFWGVERRFWELGGVYSTAAGYAGGELEHPTYRDVCSGTTGHAEVVLVVYDPAKITYEKLLEVFWNGHRPGKQGRGRIYKDQYRSVIFTTTAAQETSAQASLQRYQQGLGLADDEQVASEVLPAPTFYYAEQYHQQYQAKR